MEICLYCGLEYDPGSDPGHEEQCLEKLVDETNVEVQSDPTLTKLLEGLLNGEKEK